MDYAALPPEVNSARMYAGPGPESLMAAAAAWNWLAGQLRSTAAAYSRVISGLTVEWQGPSAAAMAAAAAPYTGWMNTTAAQAEETATRALAAATAYETAFAATVPPPAVAANRSQLAALLATNVLGQNLPAIAATEAQYADMWAQDAAAMYGYAGQSATAAQMAPFSSPPQTTNSSAGQTPALAQAAGTAPRTAGSALSQLTSMTPRALQSLAAPAAAADPPSLTTLLSELNSSPLAQALGNIEFVTKSLRPANDALLSTTLGLVTSARTINDTAVTVEPEIFAAAKGAGSLSAGLSSSSTVVAGLGRAGMVSALSVPPSWAAATPTVRLAAAVLHGAGATAAPVATAQSAVNLFSQMGLASLAGGAVGGAVPRTVNITTAQAGQPAADNHSKTPDKLKRVLAELSQKPESVQHWHTDKAHLQSLLDQLSKKPGVHAVHLSSASKENTTQSRPRWG